MVKYINKQNNKNSMKRLNIFLILLTLLTIPLISANLGTFKQGDCVDVKTILNTTSVTLSTLNYPNGTIAVSEQDMTNVAGKTWNYTFCNTSIVGNYNYDYYDGEGNIYVNEFEITNTGESFNLQTSSIYIVALVFIVLLIVSLIFIINILPSSDAVDIEGNILQISWLKYLRPILWICVYGLGLGILFIISNMALAYIPNAMVGNFLFALYKIAFWMMIVMLPIYSIWILVRAFQDREMKKLIERGVQIKSTP